MSGTWLLFQQAEQMEHNVAESVIGGERAYRLPMVVLLNVRMAFEFVKSDLCHSSFPVLPSLFLRNRGGVCPSTNEKPCR